MTGGGFVEGLTVEEGFIRDKSGACPFSPSLHHLQEFWRRLEESLCQMHLLAGDYLAEEVIWQG